MNQQAVVKAFSHVKPGDTEYTGEGLRDFFLYRDLKPDEIKFDSLSS